MKTHYLVAAFLLAGLFCRPALSGPLLYTALGDSHYHLSTCTVGKHLAPAKDKTAQQLQEAGWTPCPACKPPAPPLPKVPAGPPKKIVLYGARPPDYVFMLEELLRLAPSPATTLPQVQAQILGVEVDILGSVIAKVTVWNPRPARVKGWLTVKMTLPAGGVRSSLPQSVELLPGGRDTFRILIDIGVVPHDPWRGFFGPTTEERAVAAARFSVTWSTSVLDMLR